MLTWLDALKVLAALVTSGGIIFSIIFFFIKLTSKYWADKFIESYKIKLQKSRFLFEKEYEATTKLIALVSEITPIYCRPDMELDDALEIISNDLGEIEISIKKYLSRYSAVISKEVKEILYRCEYEAAQNKFDSEGEKLKASDIIFKGLNDAEEKMIARLWDQTNNK